MFFEVTVAADVLGFGALPPGARVEFERTAALADANRPTVVVSGADREASAATLRDGAHLADMARLGECESGSVYRLTWADVPPLFSQLRAADCTVLSVTWTDDTLSLELRFPDPDAASRFYAEYDDPDSPLTLRHTSEFGMARQAARNALTPKQTTALVHALELGYFDVPRRTTLDGVAADLDISDTAVSQRLRRGVGNVLRSSPHLPQTVRPLADD